MSHQVRQAIVAPVDRYAGWLSDDRTFVEFAHPASQHGMTLEVADFVRRHPTSCLLKATSDESLHHQMVQAEELAYALDFALLLFDGDVSPSTRQEIADELDTLLTVPGVREHVLNIILSAPLPRNADSSGASTAAEQSQETKGFVYSIVNAQSNVLNLWSSWKAMREHPIHHGRDFDAVTGHLIHCGVFRRIAIEAGDQAQLDQLRQQLIFDNVVKLKCDPRILTAFLASVRKGLPEGAARPRAVDSATLSAVSRFPTEESPRVSVRSARASASEKKTWATRTIEKIAKIYAKGDDERADRFLEELVAKQTTDSQDVPHVVKSLCNLAGQCTTAGRREISLKCLKRALTFPEGVDSVLYLQIANQFRSIGNHDEAYECYMRAETLDDGTHSNWIRNEIIRLAVHKGEYEEACRQYQRIPMLDSDADALLGFATLLRRMGRIREAREDYRAVLDLSGGVNASAHAGLAELSKQTGHLHRAIQRYNDLFRTYHELDDHAKKVYQLARSHLFRMTGQFTAAETEYLQVLHSYPHDPDIHLHLAKLYALTGDRGKRNDHFAKAERDQLSGLAADLYALAIHSLPQSPVSATVEPDRYTTYLPEERGLAACADALALIKVDAPEQVPKLLEAATFSDRLTRDFARVLQFHSTTRLQPSLRLTRDHAICRIAKRGFPTLRRAVEAIVHRDFAAAIAIEEKMCLFVA